MQRFSITYEGPSGRQEEELPDKAIVNLHMRAATQVNLESLSNNQELTTVELSKNQLESIDLRPLHSCKNLKRLSLNENRLGSIDLWPLLGLPSVEEVNLVNNRLDTVNITPLIGKSRVLLDERVQVEIDYILRYIVAGKDSSNILLCKSAGDHPPSSPRIHWKRYSDLMAEYGSDLVCQNTLHIIDCLEERYWFRAQKGLLEGMGLSELSGYDGDPSLLLRNLGNASDFSAVRSNMFDIAVDLLEEQLTMEGPTLFLNVKKLADTRASKLIPLIARLRSREIESVRVGVDGNSVSLLPLWLTHWGYELLSVLRFGLTTDLSGFDLVKRNLNQIGYVLATEEVDSLEFVRPQSISEGLFDYICAVATMNSAGC